MAGYECSPVSNGCGETFASQEGFDDHLIRHPRTERDPDCKSVEELRAAGYDLNKFGEWFHVEKAERTQKAFSSPVGGSLADSGAVPDLRDVGEFCGSGSGTDAA